jgi:hypothetical protein
MFRIYKRCGCEVDVKVRGEMSIAKLMGISLRERASDTRPSRRQPGTISGCERYWYRWNILPVSSCGIAGRQQQAVEITCL